MAMTRREFVKHLALLAAGAMAMPAQIAAFERTYDVNSRIFGERTDLLAVSEFSFGFEGVPQDLMAVVSFIRRSNGTDLTNGTDLIRIVMNYRSNYRWIPQPDAPLLSTVADLQWDIDGGPYAWAPNSLDNQRSLTEILRQDFAGTLRFTDQEGLIHSLPIDGRRRRLQEYYDRERATLRV